MVFCGIPLIGQKRPMNGAQLHPLRVGEAGGRLKQNLIQNLTRNKNSCSTEQDAMVFCGIPLIGQKRPMNGAQFLPSRVGEAGGRLIQNLMQNLTRNKNSCSTEQDAMMFCGIPLIGQKRPMNGAQLHPSRVGEAGGRLTQYSRRQD
jgi:hypothetical protein